MKMSMTLDTAEIKNILAKALSSRYQTFIHPDHIEVYRLPPNGDIGAVVNRPDCNPII